MEYFTQAISSMIHQMKYSVLGKDKTIVGTWARVAKAIALAEKSHGTWTAKFCQILEDFVFIPAGRILTNAGTDWRTVTMSNCFIQDYIPDDFDGIFNAVVEVAKTLRAGGGVGLNFSRLRPRGAKVYSNGAAASGPVGFMEVFDSSCRVIEAGNRRGAMNAMLDTYNYDLMDFIKAKDKPGYLSMFNTSVLVSDEFMAAVKADAEWKLVYKGMEDRVYKAREIWDAILEHTYKYNEPGVLFHGTMVKENNLWYIEGKDVGVNPCGEIVLGMDYGSCLLGHLNLVKFVLNPFTPRAAFDFEKFYKVVPVAVRFLDDVLDVNLYPLEKQKKKALETRRIGLGVTGYADMLVMMGLRYGSLGALSFTSELFKELLYTAYEASQDIGIEKGPFPLLNVVEYKKSGFLQRNKDVLASINLAKMRNSQILTVAPTGTISVLANNVSSGIEPIFELEYRRKVITGFGSEGFKREEFDVVDYAYWQVRPEAAQPVSDCYDVAELKFVTYKDITVDEKLATIETIQRYIDNAVSNTTNIPHDYPFDEFKTIYQKAYEKGLKGITTYRQGTMDDVLKSKEEVKPKDSTGKVRVQKRPKVLKSVTYKQKMTQDDTYYITISDVYDPEFGGLKPFELFINSTKYNPDATAVSLLLSAAFRKTETFKDYDYIIYNLRKIQDPNVVVSDPYLKRTLRSVWQAISYFIEEHLKELADGSDTVYKIEDSRLDVCPKCGEHAFKSDEGCVTCLSCGYSRCG